MSKFDYNRRLTTEVKVGNIGIGGDNPIRVQSMTNTSTMDTNASVAQAQRMIDAGSELVRLTAQGVREAENIGQIREILHSKGYNVPLVADIHFNPKAAFAATGNADKVRINPGNFVDPGRTFRKLEYSDEEYASEIKKLESAVVPFLEKCRKENTAIRIGVNHGSLSDRIMSHYGDTPAGMVESALEFLRICKNHNFKDVVVSIKASNVVVMVETVRLLAEEMSKEGMSYPLHLGVTEAGDGEDGRIKSAVGIGTLLLDGLGDTIRVSLSEEPEAELPVAKALVNYIDEISKSPQLGIKDDEYVKARKRYSVRKGLIGGDNVPVVIGNKYVLSENQDLQPDFSPEEMKDWLHLEAPLKEDDIEKITDDAPIVLHTHHPNFRGAIESAFYQLIKSGKNNPVIIKRSYTDLSKEETSLRAAVDFGSVLLDGFGNGIFIESDVLSQDECTILAFKILQSVRLRITSTEYISCPGCGRTLFDLQTTLSNVKKATEGLKGVKIGVMGCIVNGPGEMADADYGYVGAGLGKISLYKGKECVKKNIPEEEAVEALLELIEKDRKNE